MGMFDDVEGIVKRQMVLFFVVDTSGSMQGTKIGAVNTAIREVLPELKDAGGSDVDLKVACLTFSSGCKWMYSTPIASDSFQWNNVDADGVTDLGSACRELSEKLSKNGFLKAPSGSVAPAIFLMSDGEPTDYGWELAAAKCREAQQTKKVVIHAVGTQGANLEKLAKFSLMAPKRLSGLKFTEFFLWLSRSVSCVSRAAPNMPDILDEFLLPI